MSQVTTDDYPDYVTFNFNNRTGAIVNFPTNKPWMTKSTDPYFSLSCGLYYYEESTGYSLQYIVDGNSSSDNVIQIYQGTVNGNNHLFGIAIIILKRDLLRFGTGSSTIPSNATGSVTLYKIT